MYLPLSHNMSDPELWSTSKILEKLELNVRELYFLLFGHYAKKKPQSYIQSPFKSLSITQSSRFLLSCWCGLDAISQSSFQSSLSIQTSKTKISKAPARSNKPKSATKKQVPKDSWSSPNLPKKLLAQQRNICFR